MKQPETSPPKWVRFFSWCFAYLTIIPILVAGQLIFRGDIFGLSAYGFSIEEGSNQLHFTIMLAGAILLGGLTGIFILTRCKFAYDFGITYSLITLMIISYGCFVINHPLEDGGLQGVLIALFLAHLIRNRSSWLINWANKTAHTNPLPRFESEF